MGSSGSKVSSSSGKGKGCSVKLFHSCYCLGLPSECRDRRNNGDNDQRKLIKRKNALMS
ncbi:conserved hypothetical protein [Ricinus communis]|uniref:Uncharacterized protein n=1 Tax=Ricinus communis TaxID=3988 RepID=B9S1Q2_RICCO|nr:conserved hypothetical protein [Ricinus communis]